MAAEMERILMSFGLVLVLESVLTIITHVLFLGFVQSIGSQRMHKSLTRVIMSDAIS